MLEAKLVDNTQGVIEHLPLILSENLKTHSKLLTEGILHNSCFGMEPF